MPFVSCIVVCRMHQALPFRLQVGGVANRPGDFLPANEWLHRIHRVGNDKPLPSPCCTHTSGAAISMLESK